MSKFKNIEDEIWEELDNFDGADDFEDIDGLEKSNEFGISNVDETPSNMVIDIVREDGSKESFEIIGRMDMNGNSYLLLYPLANNEEQNLIVERFVTGENDEIIFVPMDSEEEKALVMQEMTNLL